MEIILLKIIKKYPNDHDYYFTPPALYDQNLQYL